MIPSTLTDEELLRLYEDIYRQHPATAELAKRRTESAARIAWLEAALRELVEHPRRKSVQDAARELLSERRVW